MYFSIDNHHLTIIANDFVDLVPYNTTIVTLGVSLFQIPNTFAFADAAFKTGQRSDVLFTPKSNGTIWMRTLTHGKFCGGNRALNPEARAIIFVDDAPETSVPTTSAWPPPVDDLTCSNVRAVLPKSSLRLTD